MANITVDWNELKNKGQEMMTESEKMGEHLEDIKKQIVRLNDTWKSNSADEMVNYINGVMTNAFARYQEVVKEYGQFLDNAAEQYANTESTLTKAANNMLDFN